MTDFIKYQSIENLKNFNHKLQSTAEFHGLKPETINFEGAVKVHGTNAALVLWLKEDTYNAQSRVKVLGMGKQDNAGFAQFAEKGIGLEGLKHMTSNVYTDKDTIAIAVYGEWAGGGIQKGVAVSGMEKKFIVFEVQSIQGKSFDKEGEVVWERIHQDPYFLNYSMVSEDVCNMHDFGTYKVTVDFSDLPASMDELERIKFAIEDNCPVGTTLNPNATKTIGEGVVFSGVNAKGEYVQFKHKGKKHKRAVRAPRVSLMDKLHDEQKDALMPFLEEAVSGERLMQGVEMMKLEGHPILMPTTGKYLIWIMEDIRKEMPLEIDDLTVDHGLVWKVQASFISKIAREFWVAHVEEVNEG